MEGVKENLQKALNRPRKEKGITLVALVITIVVIIILAMITINFLFGENGLITKAQEAKKMSEIEEVREKLEMATGTAIIDGKGHTTIDDYFELIESEGIIGNKDSDTLDNGDGTYDVTTNEGFIFQVMPVPEKDNADDILIDYVGETNGPRIKSVTATTTTNSATIEVEAVNAENAVYKYEYKKNGESDWQALEGENGSTCTINNLEENEIYNIRVTVEVTSGGNKGTATREINVRTGEMPTGAITFEQETWQGDGTASVVVHSSQEGYTIQYQIVVTGSVTDPEELEEANWKPVANGGQITGIQHNQTVYARLWDGHNGSSYASADIKDTEVPQEANIQLSSTNVTTGTTVTATVTHVDSESGPEITQCRYVWNTSSGKIGTDASSYTGGAFSSNGQQISRNMSSRGTYYLHVLTVDKAGNKWETVSSGITVRQLVTSISVSPATLTLEEGETSQLTATVSPNNTTDKSVTWSSNNTSVATVSNNGTVTAVSEGTATITATAKDGSNVKGMCSVTVEASNTIENILKAGDWVTYPSSQGNIECVVLYDSSSEYGVEIIAMEIVEEVELGNGTGSSSSSISPIDFNTAMDSYNNAISTLNTRAGNYNNSIYSTRARCVGSDQSNPTLDNPGYFTSSYSWFSSYNGKLKNGDTHYKTDWNQMGTLGIRNLNYVYWLASRNMSSDSCIFFTRIVGNNLGSYELCSVIDTGRTYSRSYTAGLRPIFLLKSGIIVTGGSGTESSPYTLGT